MNKFIVSSSPHFQSKDTTQTLMLDVILALTPAMNVNRTADNLPT